MFGLEERKKSKGKRAKEETFELEEELRDPVKYKEIKERVDGCVQELKQTLRSGEKKEEFEDFAILLHGYAALQRLITRLSKNK